MGIEYIKNIYNKFRKNKSYIVLSIILVFLIYCAYKYFNDYRYIFRDPKKMKNIIMSYGSYSIVVFFFLQVLQVVAFFIPGELIQIAGGYIYGIWFGGVISILGITTGSAIIYGLARFYGRTLVNNIISEKDLKFFKKILNLGSMNFIVFLLYVIPGIPKDVLGYICGVSDISFKNFILYSTLGRIPGIFISAYFGSNLISGNKSILIIIAIVMSLLFVVGVFKGEKIIKKMIKNSNMKNS